MSTDTNDVTSARVSENSQPIPGFRVSVLVPTFNRANYIAECLDSLLSQTMPALEIIVIDDGSEDGTVEVLKSYEKRIRYFRKENGGKPSAVNLGLSLAEGELIWIFDDDDVALPTAIASRVNMLKARPDAGFVFSPHFYGTDGFDGKISQGRLHQIPAYSPENFLFELMKGCFFHLATALVWADVYKTVGGFDAELLSSEDYDMQLRLAQAFPAAYCLEPSFIFRQHTGLRGAKAIRYGGAQRTKIFQKFDQRVGRKLRIGLLLGDYLVPREVKIESLYVQRKALLNRMTVMASKGCLPEMIDDLQSILALLSADEIPLPAERQTVAEAICTGYAADAIESQWCEFKLLLAGLLTSAAGRTFIRSVSLGLFKLAKGYPGTVSVRWLRLKQAGFLAIYSLTTARFQKVWIKH